MSEAAKTFDHILRASARDALRERGFDFDRSRTFRRYPIPGAISQIVNFQLGQRSMEGRFTVNLGVYVPGEVPSNPADLQPDRACEYHCAWKRRERLGRLLPRPLPALQNVPLLGALFGPQDVWWTFSTDAARTQRSMERVLALLLNRGLAWLDAATPGRGGGADGP
jgi:hypothetical protein